VSHARIGISLRDHTSTWGPMRVHEAGPQWASERPSPQPKALTDFRSQVESET
jgi:hypothetical protein